MTPSSRLYALPLEVMQHILELLNPVDLSRTRLVSKYLCACSDHPRLWRNIQLNYPSEHHAENEPSLIKLVELKSILGPHLSLVQTLHIWGVRDNIVQYIISNCHNLQSLTISGWSTLSDHAFRFPSNGSHLCLRQLRLIGMRKSNYTSLDATAFGKLIAYCPNLEEISVLSCQVHIQAESLLQMVKSEYSCRKECNKEHASPLRSFTVATKRSWSRDHVARLFQLCSNLCFLGLVTNTYHESQDHLSSNTVNNRLNEWTLMAKSIDSIDELPAALDSSDNIIIYRST